jgi:hypothetical protein
MDARLATVRSGSWEAMNPMQQLGAWATSEEEPKPMRGSRGTITGFLGAWSEKTLKPKPARGKGMRGAPKQCRR